MAIRFVVVALFLAVALLLVIEEASNCGNGYRCISVEAAPAENQGRKVLHGTEEAFKSFGSSRDGGSVVGQGFRTVPSGPDPLHHNGGAPKKPETP